MKSKTYSYSAPTSKSSANRALILAAMAAGKSLLKNVPYGEDVDLMIENLRKLGCNIIIKKTEKNREIHLAGLINKFDQKEKYSQKTIKLFTGNAGTATRFILAIATIMNKKVILDCGDQMRHRPIADLVQSLEELGAKITYEKEQGQLPVTIHPQVPTGGKTSIRMNKTSQFASALLLLAPFLQKQTTIQLTGKKHSISYLESTLSILKKWNILYVQKNSSIIEIKPRNIKARKYTIDPDIASASYIIAIAKLHQKPIRLNNIDPSSSYPEKDFFKALKKVGSSSIIDGSGIPDTVPTLAALAALTPGKTIIKNIDHLQYKESNRLEGMYTELKKIGVKVKKTSSSLTIWGSNEIKGGVEIETYSDHRFALAFSIIKSKFQQIAIQNPEVVQKSYPNYWNDYRDIMLELNKNIVLIGMPGSGKTTLGKKLAKKWNYHYLDLDEVFEAQEKKTIASFVEKYGWETFREKETKILEKLKPKSRMIIGTGGGIILNDKHFPVLRNLGTVIYLKTTFETLLGHVRKDPRTKTRRPQRNINSKEELLKLYNERLPFYSKISQLAIEPIEESSNASQDTNRKIQQLEHQLFYI